MDKIKIIIVCLVVPFFILIAFTFWEIKNEKEFRQKTVLAHELQRVLEPLMFDLREARENTIDVPADGLWHDRISFIEGQQGVMEYLVQRGRLFRINNGKILMVADNIADLCIRRQKETPDILEVRIKAQKNVSLVSNLRIRVRQ